MLRSRAADEGGDAGLEPGRRDHPPPPALPPRLWPPPAERGLLGSEVAPRGDRGLLEAGRGVPDGRRALVPLAVAERSRPR